MMRQESVQSGGGLCHLEPSIGDTGWNIFVGFAMSNPILRIEYAVAVFKVH